MLHDAAYQVAVLCEDQQHFERVRALTDGDDSWFEVLTCDIARLEQRGAGNGCAAFLREIRERIVPLVRGDV